MARTKSVKRPKIEEFVLDSSMAVAWSFEDEVDDYADRVQGELKAAATAVGVQLFQATG